MKLTLRNEKPNKNLLLPKIGERVRCIMGSTYFNNPLFIENKEYEVKWIQLLSQDVVVESEQFDATGDTILITFSLDAFYECFDYLKKMRKEKLKKIEKCKI